MANLTAYRHLTTWAYAHTLSRSLAVLMHASYTGWLFVLYPATSVASMRSSSLADRVRVQAGLWRGFAVRDGNLLTGQQNFSGMETAEALIRALGE